MYEKRFIQLHFQFYVMYFIFCIKYNFRVHEKLLRLQKVQLDNLNQWLSEMENKLKNLPSLGPTLDAIKSQDEMQKVCIYISFPVLIKEMKIIRVFSFSKLI